ncbi:monovalent cation:proton antiporter-2 (CPA2) family protein [Stappia indica]|uniref:monovalent cation:proton antiporter-2 (CPA2) family protein n=1 Tax=Stappia indica TaxID=538381 RepID=UPI001CD75DF0|nr:monovalent cation:proton antiporter-2 (CPA2) family protein [Stappia indica]MCA1297754.1 monovalent cation:proton antiporter-2 (CPA2) family protein [Stappia indica]
MASELAPPFFVESILFLSATVVAVPLAKRIGLGSVVGYLAAGMAIGPFGLDFIQSGVEIRGVAELGVVLLLFVIGLELEPARLWRMKGDIFGLGTSQVLACGAALVGLLLLAGQPVEIAVIAGLGLALSSTAFALQILQERGHLSTAYGQRAFGILLLQDMAIVPLLALIPILSPTSGPSSGSDILIEVATTVAAVGGVIVTGRYLLTPFFGLLAAVRAREVMLAAALLVALGSGGIMHAAGLSMALGAFLAGVMLAESSFRHTLEADIDPFRSLLMGLFFISVGMALDLGLVAANWQLIAIGVAAVMSIKGGLIWGLSRLFGSTNSDALKIAVTLPQGGEFAFVLFTAAASASILPYDQLNLLIAIVVLTMLMTPLACLAHDFLAGRLRNRGVESHAIEGFAAAKPTVLVIGFGRFGMMVAQMLTSEEIEITALDIQPERMAYARKLGYKVYYGDATRPDVLKAAGADEAVLIALCIENDQVMARAIDLIRSHFPQAKLYCRATDRAHALDLTRRGVEFQIRETFESSITFGRAALEALGIAGERVSQIEDDVRRRDRERLEMQLTDGPFAGADRLHQVTPRGAREKPTNAGPAED